MDPNAIVPTVTLYGPNLVGILLPPLIDILNKDIPEHKTTERFLASMAICFTIAFLVKLNEIQVGNYDELFTSFGLIFTESQAVYRLYFKDSFLRAKLQERIAPDDEEEVTPTSNPSLIEG